MTRFMVEMLALIIAVGGVGLGLLAAVALFARYRDIDRDRGRHRTADFHPGQCSRENPEWTRRGGLSRGVIGGVHQTRYIAP